MPKPTRVFFILLLLFACLTCSFPVFSQNSIKGVIGDSLKAPVPFCAVALLHAKDSTIAKGNLADENGSFMFEKIKPGTYLIKCAAVGFKPFISGVLQVDSLSALTLDTLQLKPDGVNLKEVSVSVIKPAVEFKKGTVVLNVENNILAGGNTVLDLLRRLPGVTIDAQNNIAVNGRPGVRFLIDGRLQQIPTAQMMTVLSGMSADAVSTIELIKNPPARYDASGGGGLINIVLKKAKTKGFNGSLSESLSRGMYFRNGNTASFNFKSNKVSVFTNLAYYDLLLATSNYELRRMSRDSVPFEVILSGKQLTNRNIPNGSAGLDYEFSKKLTFGCNISDNAGNISTNDRTQAGTSSSAIYGYDYYKVQNYTKQQVDNPSLNVNGTYKFDTLGTQLQMSADATSYSESFTRSSAINFYNNADQEAMLPYQALTGINNKFRIYTQKLDFTRPFKKSLTFEAGAKSSFVKAQSSSNVQLTDSLTRELKTDSSFSNNYLYHERILAAYVTLSKSVGPLDAKAGLRTEHTLIDASNAPKPFTLHRNYLNFFPSASIDYKITKKHSVQLNYSYRIDRPNYDQLSPTRVYNDQLNYGIGNPSLKPQYSHCFTAEYNYNSIITLGAGYYNTSGFIYYYSYGNPNTKITVDTVFNYGQRNHLAATLFIQKQIKWLSFQVFGMGAYRNFIGQVNGVSGNSQTFQYYSNFNVDIVLPSNFKLQLNGFYNSKFHDGVQVYYPSGSMDIGLLRSFFNKKLDVTLSFYDVFYTQRFPLSNSVGSQYSYYVQRSDSRRIRAYIVWKFGKIKIEQASKRSNDAESGRLKKVN